MSLHKAIYGQTLSGKSSLAKMIVKTVSPSRGVAVYDPTLSDWQADFVTDDIDLFFDWIEENYMRYDSLICVVDEADTVFSIGQKVNHWLATRGRHFGIVLIFITQRPQLVAPTVRGQTGEQFVFYVGKKDAAFLADEHGHDGLLEACNLKQGECLRCHWVDGKKVVDKLKIF